MFASGLVHLLVIRRDPDRSAWFELTRRWEFFGEIVPEPLRVFCECKLSLRVVHNDDMSHSGRGRSGRHAGRFDHDNLQSFCCQCSRTSGSYDTCSYDSDVISHRSPIPKQNGSFSSKINSLSAVIKADPRIDGMIFSSTMFTVPSKILPMMLSCRQVSPGRNLPSA